MIQKLLILSILMASPVFAAEGYNWVKLEKAQSQQVLHLTGRIVPQDGALSIISARVAGRILSFLKKEGERVEVGTALYQVSSAECLSLTEEKRVAESRKMEDFVSAVARREKQLGLQLKNDNCSVISNFSGTLVKRNLEIGAVFNPGDALATVVDTHRLTVELEVPEGEISRVKLADRVQVKVAGRGTPISGTVDVIVPTVDTGTRTSKIRLKEIKSKDGLSLDSLVSGDLEIKDPGAKVFLVPQAALVFFNNKNYVLKRKGNEPSIVPVKIINDLDQSTLIQPENNKDMQEGDSIIATGALFIFNKIHEDQLK